MEVSRALAMPKYGDGSAIFPTVEKLTHSDVKLLQLLGGLFIGFYF